MPIITKECEICSGEIRIYESHLKHGKGRFCSNSCKSKFGRSLQDTTGEKNGMWKGGVWKSNTLLKVAEWRRDNPVKVKAHQKLQQAVRDGKMQRGSCVDCGATENIDGHHDDYSKPLDVEWLCRSCHLKRHRRAA